MILIMTVEPGFGGQSFMADQLGKIKRARELVKNLGLDIWFQVDGGVALSTIEQCLMLARIHSLQVLRFTTRLIQLKP